MQLSTVLQRIDQRRTELGLSDQALSLQSGLSKDLMRNWRRRANAGAHSVGANVNSLSAIAKALGVSLEWLMTGADENDALSPPSGHDVLDIRVHDGRVYISANLGPEGLSRLRKSLDGIATLIDNP